MTTPPPPHTFLTVGSPYDAAVQLIYKFTGHYRLVRQSHFSHIWQDTTLSLLPSHHPQQQQQPLLLQPSHGTCTITYRTATDPTYEVELLQTTVINLQTVHGQTAIKVEKQAFRILNARWSLWAVRTDEEGIDVVGEKLADLVFGEVKAEEWVALGEVEDVMQKVTLRGGPWVDGEGSHAVGMCVWVGRRTCWQLSHQIDRVGEGRGEICSDEFWPVVEMNGVA